ncbi:hypothetical protein TNCV_1403771 [Trichonephila clavipes]|nr:hypothetical protein TNCV_1403771 [Trichonephila clavipes]
MHLVPTFGTPAPANSIPEGTTGSTITRHYPAKLLEFFKSDSRFLFPSKKNTGSVLCTPSKNFKPFEKAPVTVREINSRPELSGKFATISHVEYQIQITRLKIRQKSSFRAPRLLNSPPGDSTAYQFLHRLINSQVANRVAKNDASLALSPIFRYASIESPL